MPKPDPHTGQTKTRCACGRWIVYGTSHPTLTQCNCGGWHKPHSKKDGK